MQEIRLSPSHDREWTATRRTPESPRRVGFGNGSAAPPADRPGGPTPAPDWVPDDDLITKETDRQVLVAGDTVAGLALTLLLDRAGYDPVLVGGAGAAGGTGSPAPTTASRLAYLWPPALRLLDTLGVDVSALDCGVSVDGVDVRAADGTLIYRAAETASARPVLVRTARLRQRLEARLPDVGQGRDRAVDSLSRREGGLVVAFDDGVREWFDVAVDTVGRAGSLRGDGGQATPAGDGEEGEVTTLTQYEVPVRTDAGRDAMAAPARTREAWQPGALVQSLPRPGRSGRVLRVTTADDTLAALTGTVQETLPDGATGVPAALSGVEPAGVRQVSSLPADPARTRWGRGRVALCGEAACPFPPASGVRTSAGIEDALALVSELSRGPRATVDAVEAYAARRARRVGTLVRAAAAARTDHAYPVPDRTEPGVATLGLLRTVALAPFLGAPVAALQREGFE